MDVANLASTYSPSSNGGPQTLLEWLVLGGICVVAAVGIIVLLLFLNRVSREEPKIKGPALTGTARVLSMKTGIAVGNYPQRIMCRIGLRVEVPGRQPYKVRVRQGFLPWAMDAIEPGRTVPVQVDSTNPQKVRIDFNQPIRQPAAQSPGSPPNLTTLADLFKQSHGTGAGPVMSAVDVLASGQRVPGVLKSFAATGTTPRSLGRTSSRPELIDAPHYMLVIELQLPNLAPVEGRLVQPVPPAQVPNLAIGLKLACAVDPANPTQQFAVDWDAIARA
jgi:hypothetical protein